jgi:5-deoxy-glucuronate isomerase
LLLAGVQDQKAYGALTLSESQLIVSSSDLAPGAGGKLLSLPREQAGWEWMSFYVTRLQPGESLRLETAQEELALVLLGGTSVADWGEGPRLIGKRKNVFDGLPYTIYLPPNSRASLTAETVCEFAECRVPSQASLSPRLITPNDVVTSLRGGGNVSRQIVDVLPPAFPADKIVVIEVYTPGGNWSSYPPHKHDQHNPPKEVDQDEIYYYRTARPEGFAFQYLYSDHNAGGRTLRARDGDAVLVHSGYHAVVAGPGYDIYYLNFLAGSSRNLAVNEDPNHSWIRSTWNGLDPRLPLVRK